MKNKSPLTLILIGPSGSGKGTQAVNLKEKYNFEHIEMGRIIRDEALKDTEQGRMIKKIVMDQGKLIPTQVSWDLIKDTIYSVPQDKGILFDGFPRTLDQVGLLDKALEELGRENICVINVDVPGEVSLRRLLKRLVCNKCGDNFVENDIKAGDKCPKCDGILKRRSDDTKEKIKERLRWSAEKVRPVIEEYRNRGLLTDVRGDEPEEEVYNKIVKAIAKCS